MTQTYSTFISFHLADAAGILFYGHVFTLAHQAYEQFIREDLNLSWEWWFHNPEWIVPIRHAESDYTKPIVVGKPCMIKMQLAELRKSSFTFNYIFIQDDIECCKVKITHVFCNRNTQKALSIPTDIRELLHTVDLFPK